MDKGKEHKKDHFLSQEEMEKYLRGELSPSGQHRVEKILLDEGFEAEAMEGFLRLGVKHAGEDLAYLREQLRKKAGHSSFRQLIRIAAAVLLLGLFSFGVYFLIDKQPEERTISYNLNEPSAGKEETKIQSNEKTVLQEERVFSEAEPSPKSAKGSGSGDVQVTEKTQENEKEQTPAMTYNPPNARISNKKTVMTKQKATLNEHLQEAEQVSEGREYLMTAPSAVRAVAETADYSLEYTPAVPDSGLVRKPVGQDRDGIVKIEDQPSGAKSRSYSDENAPARPSTGINAYKRYIKENIRYPGERINEAVKGNVLVIFTVTASGEIKYVHIEKSLGDLFDKEAVRLILSGPKWLPAVKDGVKIDKEVRLSIRFDPPGR